MLDEPTSKISFLGFLASQPAERLDALYGSRWTCAALLRALPPLGKHLTLRLLHIETPLTLGARARGRPPSPRAAAHARRTHDSQVKGVEFAEKAEDRVDVERLSEPKDAASAPAKKGDIVHVACAHNARALRTGCTPA